MPSDSAQELPVKRTRGTASNSKRLVQEEALRLVQQVFLLQNQEPPHVVIMAGVDHGSGCSLIAAAVSETLAQHASRPVCLVEANFRSPSLREFFGVTNRQGLTEALVQPGPISAFTEPVANENLWLLSSGAASAESANLLTSGALSERLTELRREFEFVIIDAPPLSRYSDALVLGQHADGLVLILEADSTRREAASVVATSLRSAAVKVLAAVLNKREFPIPSGIYSKL